MTNFQARDAVNFPYSAEFLLYFDGGEGEVEKFIGHLNKYVYRIKLTADHISAYNQDKVNKATNP